MLEPNDRAMLQDLLRPPEGSQLDIAVGTTYSLDLISLLSAPVAFALFDIDSESLVGKDEGDQAERSAEGGLEILEAVRRYASRTTVFAMAGQISVPTTYRSVLTYTEDSVIEVRRPREDRVFHPKVWALRYRFLQGPDRFHHRVIALSRNLTYDKSWDVTAVLDEAAGDKGARCAAPLAEFLRGLPGLAAGTVPKDRHVQVHDLAGTLEMALFEVPEPFKEMRMIPIGPGLAGADFPKSCDRALVISPFLSEVPVRKWSARSAALTLVSRAEELDALPLSAVPERSYVLSAHVQPFDEQDSELSGLHAKVYVADQGEDSTWWLGSANCTHAAFDGNSEFFIELTGPKSKVGVKKLLEPAQEDVSLTALLEPYTRSDLAPEEGLPRELAPEDAAVIAIAEAGLALEVGEAQEEGQRVVYPVSVFCTAELPPDLTVTVKPLALKGDDEFRVLEGGTASWPGVSLQGLSPYVVVRIVGQRKVERVVIAELVGDPPHRRDAVLASLIASQEGFLHYLLLLLSDGALNAAWSGALDAGPFGDSAGRQRTAYELPLLESLLRSLSRNPADLTRVGDLLSDLRRTPEGARLVPEEFVQLWEPISMVLAQRAGERA